VGSGVDFQIYSDLRKNGCSAINTEYLLFSVTDTVSVLFRSYLYLHLGYILCDI